MCVSGSLMSNTNRNEKKCVVNDIRNYARNDAWRNVPNMIFVIFRCRISRHAIDRLNYLIQKFFCNVT